MAIFIKYIFNIFCSVTGTGIACFSNVNNNNFVCHNTAHWVDILCLVFVKCPKFFQHYQRWIGANIFLIYLKKFWYFPGKYCG